MESNTVNQSRLPPNFPTHGHHPEFWEQLGRCVATFGLLEEVLGKAIFAFTATTLYQTHEIDVAYTSWPSQLEKALYEPLAGLITAFEKAGRANQSCDHTQLELLVQELNKAAQIRNLLRHGSSQLPDSKRASIPFFVNRKVQVFDTPIDTNSLKQIQASTANLICSVVDTITRMGFQFPGSGGPGIPII